VRYSLEVGSPGLERALYGAEDYERFAGKLAKVKLLEALDGQRVLRGTLRGRDATGSVLIETERRVESVLPSQIGSGQLIFDWRASSSVDGAGKGRRRGGPKSSSNRSR
jgi:ribosome maturation factor RimP